MIRDNDLSGDVNEDGDQSWNDYSGGGDVVQRRKKALRHHLTECSPRMCLSFTKEVKSPQMQWSKL